MESWSDLVVPRSWLEGYPGWPGLGVEPVAWPNPFLGLPCPACGSRMDEIEEDERGALVRHARRAFPCRVRRVDPEG